MPTPGQLQEAVQFPDTAFADPVLQACEPVTDALGLPRAATGTFAAVFHLRGVDDWAVKAYFADDAGRRARYAALARCLEAHPISEVVPFEYQPAGLRVEGRTSPLLKMPFVAGAPLDRFVAAHLHAPDTLRALAAAWADLVACLDAAGLAHGDLQHGNVFVEDAPEGPALRLVDLDAATAPGAPAAPEAGHRNYAHPDRAQGRPDPHPDRLPALLIYTALVALAARPGLWDRYSTGENLLFRAEDLLDPAASPLLATLDTLPETADLARAIRASVQGALGRVPALAAVLAGDASAFEVAGVRGGVRGRTAAENVLGLAAVGLIGLGVWRIGVDGVRGTWLLLAGALVWGLAVAHRYRALDLVRHRRRLTEDRVRLANEARRFDQRRAGVEEARAAVLASAEAMEARRLEELRADRLRERLRGHLVQEAVAAGAATPRTVVRLKSVGIRTAWEATPARLRTVPDVGDTTRAAVLAWRQALEARYASEIPAALSASEQRRLDRMRAHRADDLARDASRLAERAAALRAEAERHTVRLGMLQRYGLAAYVRYILCLGPPPPAPHAPPVRSAGQANATPLPADAAWWQAERVEPSSPVHLSDGEP